MSRRFTCILTRPLPSQALLLSSLIIAGGGTRVSEGEEAPRASSPAEATVHNDEAQPWLLFTMGPTGSGKSPLARQAVASTKEEPGMKTTEPVMMLIDDYVENDDDYKRHIKEYLAEHLCNNTEPCHPSIQDITAWTARADEAVYAFFEARYKATRVSNGCRQFCDRHSNGKKTCGCDDQFDDDLQRHLLAGENIIFETTAENLRGMKWVAKEVAKQREVPYSQSYKLLAAANYLPFCELVKRNADRAAYGILNFLISGGPAPRFPDLSTLGDKVKQIVENEGSVMDCVQKDCDYILLDRFDLYDNGAGQAPVLKWRITSKGGNPPELAREALQTMFPKGCELEPAPA